MSITKPFKFNEYVEYRVGGVYDSTHQFSLVHQRITIKEGKSFDVRFPNIWQSYKAPGRLRFTTTYNKLRLICDCYRCDIVRFYAR